MGLLLRSIKLILLGRERGYRARLRAALFGQPAEKPTPPPTPAPVSEKNLLCRLSDLSQTEPYEVNLKGQALVVFLTGEEVVTVSGDCPHAGAPLGDAQLHEGQLTCRAHGWTFNSESGLSQMCPNTSLTLWQSTVKDDRVYLVDKKFVADTPARG